MELTSIDKGNYPTGYLSDPLMRLKETSVSKLASQIRAPRI